MKDDVKNNHSSANKDRVNGQMQRGVKPKVCEWNEVNNIDYEWYETSCHEQHFLNSGNLEESKMKYCCYCGGEIREIEV